MEALNSPDLSERESRLAFLEARRERILELEGSRVTDAGLDYIKEAG